jgi:hypothetical protein
MGAGQFAAQERPLQRAEPVPEKQEQVPDHGMWQRVASERGKSSTLPSLSGHSRA